MNFNKAIKKAIKTVFAISMILALAAIPMLFIQTTVAYGLIFAGAIGNMIMVSLMLIDVSGMYRNKR